jgi:hypothetical protein
LFQENEIIMLLLGMGVLILTRVNRVRLERIPASKFLVAVFYTLVTGWAMTVLEGFFWEDFLNHLEHICYAASSLLMALWCWKVFVGKHEAR